jgi:DNA repair photolyase
VNPYRGCQHACAYCFARPNHQLLGFGAGTDFDRKIVVKINAAERLALELARPSWNRETVVFSGNTDCYQPLEASYELTRRCFEVCLARSTPISVITKSALIRRDVDVLRRLEERCGAHVSISIPFLDEGMGRKIEPGASSPNKRFETMRLLSEAGIPTAIGIAPLIPGLNDSDVPRLLERAKDCGATSAFMTLLRLPAEVLPVFRERLWEAFPERAKKVESAILDVRDGKMYRSDWGLRMHGSGPRWQAIQRLFDVHCKRFGFNEERVGARELDRSPAQSEFSW